MTMGQVADSAGIRLTTCCLYLRCLNARGLLKVKRVSQFVLYWIGSDPSVKHAQALSDAVVQALKNKKDTHAIESVFKGLTAFTHPRRLMIVRTLRFDQPVCLEDLNYRTHIPVRSLYLHLDKLQRREIVQCTSEGVWLTHPTVPFTQKLLSLVLGR